VRTDSLYSGAAAAMNVIAVSNSLYTGTSLFKKDNCFYIQDKEELTFEFLSRVKPEYVFFPHWSFIIPREIYENFNCVIFHMTDLPFGRGGSPLQNLIVRGIYRTKISALKCAAELDGGPVYMKRDFDLSSGSAGQLYEQAGEIVSQMIDDIIRNNPTPIEQEGEPTVFRRRMKEESDMSAVKTVRGLYDFIRMLDADGYPKAFLINNGIRYEFSNACLEGGRLTASVTIGGDYE